jgi:uncharacterized protein
MLIFGEGGLLPIKDADSTIGVALLLLGAFTMYLWVGTFRPPRALWWVFFTLWITFYLLGLGALLGNQMLTRLGGWVGIVSGAVAMYTSFAEVTNFCFGHEVVPIGNPQSDAIRRPQAAE